MQPSTGQSRPNDRPGPQPAPPTAAPATCLYRQLSPPSRIPKSVLTWINFGGLIMKSALRTGVAITAAFFIAQGAMAQDCESEGDCGGGGGGGPPSLPNLP